jgi:hypothetical protein
MLLEPCSAIGPFLLHALQSMHRTEGLLKVAMLQMPLLSGGLTRIARHRHPSAVCSLTMREYAYSSTPRCY